MSAEIKTLCCRWFSSSTHQQNSLTAKVNGTEYSIGYLFPSPRRQKSATNYDGNWTCPKPKVTRQDEQPIRGIRSTDLNHANMQQAQMLHLIVVCLCFLASFLCCFNIIVSSFMWFNVFPSCFLSSFLPSSLCFYNIILPYSLSFFMCPSLLPFFIQDFLCFFLPQLQSSGASHIKTTQLKRSFKTEVIELAVHHWHVAKVSLHSNSTGNLVEQRQLFHSCFK